VSTGKSLAGPVRPDTIHLWGGALCLDFANSVDWTADGEPIVDTDAMGEPGDLMRWGRRLGLIGARASKAGDDELAAAHDLRRALHDSFAAVARHDAPPRAALEVLTDTHAAAVAASRLVQRERAWSLDWPARDPRRVRFAVAVDAIALLGDAQRLARVRMCPGRNCGWLFLDASGRRRWCSMTTCGSREKMRRMYERRRATRSRGSAR
jgi:predicted RNA-binding Zn ribbon-like protein